MKINELLNQIRRDMSKLPPLQKKVALFVIENYQQIPFFSITKLSEEIGVSHYTIISFCNNFGYSKFSEFKNQFLNYASDLIIFNKLNDSKNLETNIQKGNIFENAIKDGVDSIKKTLGDQQNIKNVDEFVKMVQKSNNIYIVGGRASSNYANLFCTFLRYLGLKVYLLRSNNGDFWDQVGMITEKDLVIAISFPRYTALVVDCLTSMYNLKIPTVLITDYGLSPAIPYSNLVFRCELKSSLYVQCYSGCVTLIEALATAVSKARSKEATEHIQKLETKLLDSGTFL